MTAPADDPFERFLAAQAPVLEAVRAELRAGAKRTHWMWFVFPQLAGLGVSAMAARYALAGIAEASAYLAHPVLGPRLVECARLVNAVEGRSARAIFGQPDDLKFRSSMTLFSRVPGPPAVFDEALAKYFGGVPDPLTLERLSRITP